MPPLQLVQPPEQQEPATGIPPRHGSHGQHSTVRGRRSRLSSPPLSQQSRPQLEHPDTSPSVDTTVQVAKRIRFMDASSVEYLVRAGARDGSGRARQCLRNDEGRNEIPTSGRSS
jgi:hypothetical protein